VSAGTDTAAAGRAAPLRNPGFRLLMAFRICTILSY